MRVLVTGGSGFIGRHLVPRLLADLHQVMVLDRVPFGQQTDAVHCVYKDLLNVDSYANEVRHFRPDVCIHLAWGGLPDYSLANCLLNLQASAIFSDFLFWETSCRRLIAAGSCAEYGNLQGSCVEDQDPDPLSHFSWAKQSVRRLLEHESCKHRADLVWLRPFYVYGPGQREDALVPSVARDLMTGKKPAPRFPNNANDFVSVVDVAELLARSIDSIIPAGVYNVGTGCLTRVITMCKIVAQQLGIEFDEGTLEGPCGDEKTTNGAWADMKRTRRIFGWVPGAKVEKGISEYLQWLRKNEHFNAC